MATKGQIRYWFNKIREGKASKVPDNILSEVINYAKYRSTLPYSEKSKIFEFHRAQTIKAIETRVDKKKLREINNILKIDITKTLSPKLRGELGIDIVTTGKKDTSRTVTYKGRTFTEQDALKFGLNLGGQVHSLIRKYDKDWRLGAAEYMMGSKEFSKSVMREEAKLYLKWRQKFGLAENDPYYLRRKFGTKQIKSSDLPAVKFLDITIKESKGVGKEFWKHIKKTFIKENTLNVGRVLESLESDDFKIADSLNELYENLGFEKISKILHRTFLSSSEWNVRQHFKKLYAEHDGVDPWYAIGRGYERLAYDDILTHIKDNPQEFYPTNIDSLQRSTRFKPIYMERMSKVWGEDAAERWYQEMVEVDKDPWGHLQKIYAEEGKPLVVGSEGFGIKAGDITDTSEYFNAIVKKTLGEFDKAQNKFIKKEEKAKEAKAKAKAKEAKAKAKALKLKAKAKTAKNKVDKKKVKKRKK